MLCFVTTFNRLRRHGLTALLPKPPRVVVVSYVSNRKLSNGILLDIDGDKDEWTKTVDPLLTLIKLCDVSQILKVGFSATFIA